MGLKLLSEEKLEFSRPLLILGNLVLLAWILLGFIGVYLFNQLYGWLYLLFAAALIFVILRRLGCSSCYRCKSCTSGFGRLAGAFFGRGFAKRESVGNRKGLIFFIYALLFLLPVVLVSFSLIQAFSILHVFVLVCLLLVAIYSLATWIKRP